MQRESQYLLNPRNPSSASGFELDKPELALHYPHMQNPQYSLFHTQSLLPTHKPIVYDYSYASTLPSDSPVVAKQLMSNPRDCDSGSEGLRYQVPEPGLEVGTCEQAHQDIATGRDEGMNEWGVLDRLVSVSSHLGNEESSKGVRFEGANVQSVQPINQLSLRGEMDFWGYGKQ